MESTEQQNPSTDVPDEGLQIRSIEGAVTRLKEELRDERANHSATLGNAQSQAKLAGNYERQFEEFVGAGIVLADKTLRAALAGQGTSTGTHAEGAGLIISRLSVLAENAGVLSEAARVELIKGWKQDGSILSLGDEISSMIYSVEEAMHEAQEAANCADSAESLAQDAASEANGCAEKLQDIVSALSRLGQETD